MIKKVLKRSDFVKFNQKLSSVQVNLNIQFRINMVAKG